MYRVLIVEDTPSTAEKILQFVQSTLASHAMIEIYSSVEEFYQAHHSVPDIALLDIQLPGQSGIALANQLNREAPNCQIIYLTDHLDYATEVYRTEHFWFITKNRMDELLADVLQQALVRLKQEAQNILLLSLKASQEVVHQNEILYLERIKRTTRIITRTCTIQTSESLVDILGRLDSSLFVRCHNSYAINLRYVKSFHRTHLVMYNDDVILISRAYQANLRDLFGKYISEQTAPFQSLS